MSARLPRGLFFTDPEYTEAQDLRQRIVQLCNRDPHTRHSLVDALASTEKRVDYSLDILRNKRLVVMRQDGRRNHYLTPKLFQRLHPLEVLPWQDATQAPEIVRAPGHGANWAPNVEAIPVAGHVVQRYSSPPDRWAVALPAGGGVISQDQQLRREGWDVGSQWTNYLNTRANA